ncbi:sulfotransferase family protein [Oceanicella sp. SM1341]|uniref:sulfotransferase family protein n=1 Tax=Oceanicella sp. SM1341 TaxID=1548889 RepID=UPI001300872B|nr:sulfotransferase family protein [Oceanicella sp. SM1341]
MLKDFSRRTIRANKRKNIIYLNNPKVGCSTIKSNLWQAISPRTYDRETDVHDLEASPFRTAIRYLGWAEAANIFTFVRNPYTRLVSGYLDKIAGNRKDVWRWFSKRYGLSDDAEVSFDAFVELIHADRPERLDPHWKPQHLNLMYPFIRPNFVGHLESMDQDLPKVFARFLEVEGGEIEKRAPHGTGARKKASSFFDNSETVSRVRELYATDFDYFGYSRDLDQMKRAGTMSEFHQHPHTRLGLLVRLRNADDRDEKLGIIDEIEKLSGPGQDKFTQNWILFEKLRLSRGDRSAFARLKEENLEHIEDGFGFLRRMSGDLPAARPAGAMAR